MKRRLGFTLSVGAAAVAVLLVGSAARAGNGISIQFLPCCQDPCGNCCSCPWYDSTTCCLISMQPSLALSDRTGATLLDPASNWNIARNQGGVVTNLLQDMNGQAKPTGATVLWEATGIASNPAFLLGFKEEADLKLTSGYLDQDIKHPFPTYITITDIPADLAANYVVVIYTLTTEGNKGGDYTVSTSDGYNHTKHVRGNVYIGPEFHEAEGEDMLFGMTSWGNYVVFRGTPDMPVLSGTTVTITASAANNMVGGKAPVNGVKILPAQ